MALRQFVNLLNRDSPDDSQTGVNISAVPFSLEDRREVRMPTGTLGQPERLVEGRWRRQLHARKTHSYLWIFRKPKREG